MAAIGATTATTKTTGRTLLALAVCAAPMTCYTAIDFSKPLPPRAASPVVTVTRDPETLPRENGPRITGSYPSFSEPLTAANAQMTDQDAVKMQHNLSALGHARRSGSISEAEYNRRVEEMRKLAAQHGAETQAEIAN